MKKTTKGILFASALILMIFAVSFVYADETTVIVNGLKGYVWNLTLNVMNPSSGNLVVTLENDTDAATGIAKFYYTSASQTVTYSILARSGGRIVANKKAVDFGNFSTGGTTTLNLFEQQTSTPSTTTTTITINTTQNQSADTSDADSAASNASENVTRINLGSLFSNLSGAWTKTKSWSKIWLPRIGYGLIAIIILCGAGYGVFWYLKKRKKGGIFKKYEDIVTPKDKERAVVSGSGSGRKIEAQLAAAERKIKEAQADIERIKNRKSRLSEAQENFEKAQKELEEAREEF